MPPTNQQQYDEQQYQMWLKVTGDQSKAERLALEDEETSRKRGLDAAD